MRPRGAAVGASAPATTSGVKRRQRDMSAALEASLAAAARRRELRAQRVEGAARASAAHAEYARGGERPPPAGAAEPERLLDTVNALVPTVEEEFGVSNARGTFLSEADSMRVLRLLCALDGCGLNTVRTLEVVRRAVGVSSETVRKVVRVYADTGALYASSPGDRGRRVPAALADDAKVKEELLELVKTRLEEGSVVTTAVAQEYIESLFGCKPSVRVTRRHLHDLHMRYGKIPVDWARYVYTPLRQSQIRRWLLLRDWAAKEEAAGRAIIVHVDESYVDLHGHTRIGFHIHGEHFAKFPKGTGKRIVLLHAFTKDGVLLAYDATGEPHPRVAVAKGKTAADTLFAETSLNCLAMFQLDPKADYHITSANFSRYLDNVLLPTARALYPGKQVIIMMDNASTHHGHTGEGRYNPTQMNKKCIVDALLSAGCTTLRVPRADGHLKLKLTKPDVVADVVQHHSKRNQHRPTLKELANAGQAWVRAKQPQMLLTQQQSWAIANDVFLLFTVPYMPTTQPIEYVWGAVKGHLQRNFTTKDRDHVGRMMDKIEEAFYAVDLVPTVTGAAPPAAGYVRHTLEWANKHLVPMFPELESAGEVGDFALPHAIAKEVRAWTKKGSVAAYMWDTATGETEAIEADQAILERLKRRSRK